MKNHMEKMKIVMLALTVPAGLIAQAVHADEVNTSATTSKYIGIGATGVTKKSAKFGEYTGDNESTINGDFDVKGGDGGTTSWGVKGSDLGSTSRSLQAAYGNQGKWGVKFNFDELRHNISDTYQTPQQGTMGGNSFTMPADFGSVDATVGTGKTASSTSIKQIPYNPGTTVLNATQLADFQSQKIGVTRINTGARIDYAIIPSLNLQFDYNHLDQTGAKLISTASQGGIRDTVATSTTTNNSNVWGKEAMNVIMNPTKYKTDTFNLDLTWSGENGQLTAGYYGSIFKDAYNSVTWQSAIVTNLQNTVPCSGAACFVTNSMGTAPSNNFNQLNLEGSYKLPFATKLAGGLSYGKNTQKADYAATNIMQTWGTAWDMMQAGGTPATTLDGVVITTHGDLKLTNQSVDKLTMSGGVKYNERKNKSSSRNFLYTDTGAGTSFATYNSPYSNRTVQYELAGDYRFTRAQSARLTFEKEDTRRWCESNAPGAECVAATKVKENKFGGNYKLKVNEDISLNAGYNYSQRRSDFNNLFVSPIDTASGRTSIVNANDRLGFTAVPYADRNRNLLKSGVTWQASDKLDMSLSGSYTRDGYNNLLGIKNGYSDSVNVDSTYAYNENNTFSVYATAQTGERNITNGAGTNSATLGVTAPTSLWNNNLKDDGTTIGINSTHKGLMGGKMAIKGDLSYSLDKTRYSTSFLNYTTAGTATSSGITTVTPDCIATYSCGDTPTIKSKVITFKLADAYEINKNSSVSLGYMFQKRNTEDYFYSAYKYGQTVGSYDSSKTTGTVGITSNLMPTNEEAPSYTENMVTVTYNYTF